MQGANRDHTGTILWLFFFASLGVSFYLNAANHPQVTAARLIGETIGGALPLFLVPLLTLLLGRWKKSTRKTLSLGRVLFSVVWFSVFAYFALLGSYVQ